MKIPIKKQSISLISLMRQLGYIPDRKNNGEQSFSRSLREGRFPRFHIYINDNKDSWLLKLHLDQKAASYNGQTAHSGEYNGPLLEKEADRIKKTVQFLIEKKKEEKTQPTTKTKKSFWGKLFK